FQYSSVLLREPVLTTIENNNHSMSRMVRPDHRCTGRMIQHATLIEYTTAGTLRQITGSLLADDFAFRLAFRTAFSVDQFPPLTVRRDAANTGAERQRFASRRFLC
ncbi:MAG: hypothetical protein KDD91_21290, partial [Caldilinea sp.]|nr:hypothetical protein [Caldilinea sp.]